MADHYIHVRDKTTGHEYPIREALFNPAAHTRTGKPPHDRHGDLVAMKPKTTVAKEAAAKRRRSSAPSEKENPS